MEGLEDLTDAQIEALASLTDEEANKLFLGEVPASGIKERLREIVAAQETIAEAKVVGESSSEDALVAQTSPREPRDEREPAAGASGPAEPPTRTRDDIVRELNAAKEARRGSDVDVDRLKSELERFDERAAAAQAEVGEKRKQDPASVRKALRADDASTAQAGTYQGTQLFDEPEAQSPTASDDMDANTTSPAGADEPVVMEEDPETRYREEVVALSIAQKVPQVYSEAELLAVLKKNPEKGPKSKWEALAELMVLPSVQYEVTYRDRPKREKKRDRRAKKKR